MFLMEVPHKIVPIPILGFVTLGKTVKEWTLKQLGFGGFEGF